MEEQNRKVGWIGLWLAIGGMVLPTLMVILYGMGVDDATAFMCGLLFLASEVAALGCGIASRKSGPGRAALIISAVLLVWSVLMYLLYSRGSMVEGGAVEEAAAKAIMDNAAAEKAATEKAAAKTPTADTVKKQMTPVQLALGDPVVNSVGMLLLPLPAGEFQMGSPDSEPGRDDNETSHLVKISKPFYLGVYEVTQQQYEQVMGTRPWEGGNQVNRPETFWQKTGPDFPAVNVSHDDAVEFCKKLSKQEGVEYRLPTEAEWEYACRAGTTTAYSFGDDVSKLGQYAWYHKNAWDVNEPYAHRVGEKLPNSWGLYDMHGNTMEWCQDWAGPYGSEAVSDPKGPAQDGTITVDQPYPREYRLLPGGGVGSQPSNSVPPTAPSINRTTSSTCAVSVWPEPTTYPLKPLTISITAVFTLSGKPAQAWITATSSRSTPGNASYSASRCFETGLFPGESSDSLPPPRGYFGTEWQVLAACSSEVSGARFSWALPLMPFVHTLNTL